MQDFITEIKSRARRVATPEVYTIFLITLVGFGSFGLGRLSALQENKTPVRILYPDNAPKGASASVASSPTVAGEQSAQEESSLSIPPLPQGGLLVASKSGTKYHYPWCSGGKSISEKNRIWFTSVGEARAAGYQPAANCKGLR